MRPVPTCTCNHPEYLTGREPRRVIRRSHRPECPVQVAKDRMTPLPPPKTGSTQTPTDPNGDDPK